MKGYVARKGNCWYAVIDQGLDPVTGRERRRWHTAGTSRADAVKLATRLAAQNNGRNDETRSLTFGAYLGSSGDGVDGAYPARRRRNARRPRP